MRNENFSAPSRSEAGYSIINVLITLVVVGIVSSFAVLGISNARGSLRLSRSTQLLSSYMEKARLSAIRCHCTTTVQIPSTSSFSVTGPIKSATSETITLPLDQNVTFQGLTPPVTITFDWKGRADSDYHLTLVNSQGTRKLDVSGGGDVKIDSTSDYTAAPTIQANMPTDLSDGAADSYVTSFANNNSSNSNSNSNANSNPKNHKKPKK